MPHLDREFVLSLMQLVGGIVAFGFCLQLTLKADLGLDPWNLFHQALADQLGLSIGTVVVGVSALVVMLWIPLKQRPGIGTVTNSLLLGPSIDFASHVLPSAHGLVVRLIFLILGVIGSGIFIATYIGAGLGPGPRDGLMTGLASRGLSITVVRTSIEVVVLIFGLLLGGPLGVGTVAYALCVGAIVHVALGRVDRKKRRNSTALAA